ncbi:thioredoxin [Hymenobacter sp. HMF4947]|uniref:Thioredoxin n=1 Tax=Hymenobacter ginkgonis TaxID=2682976 RepID=A0A7K1TK85_9BACT|nr:thioredoxin [Hymenobacter ginkgonis]
MMLPTVGPGPEQETPLARTATNLLLQGLQAELGTAIRVLKVDEVSHPAVVRAFDGRGVPAFVLLRDGAELYRQQGLPDSALLASLLASLLLRELASAPAAPEPAAGATPNALVVN